MQYLRADTEVIVTVGPFVDVGDGFTPQTDITLGGNEAELLKHGSATVVDISGATWAAVANCRGYYSLTLTTSYTDTEGQLTVIVQDDSDCLPVRAEFQVVNANVYDSLFAAATTDYLKVDVDQVDGDSTAAANLNSACDNYSVTRGLTGTALPAVAADGVGGLPISDAGGLDMDALVKVLRSGTAQSGDSEWIQLDAGASAENDYYNGSVVNIISGLNAGQSRLITDYDGNTKAAYVSPSWWDTGPDPTSKFEIVQGSSNVQRIEGSDPTDQINAACDTALSTYGAAKPIDLRGRVTWYVDGVAGDNANGGTSWADADETIAAAIAEASAGDLILIGPGTYDETVTMDNNGMELRGAGIGATIIDPATGNGVVMDDYCVLRNLEVQADANIATGVTMGEECVIENCKIHGDRYGVKTDGSDDVIVRDSFLLAGDRMFDCQNSDRFLLVNTKLSCNDEASTDELRGLYVYLSSGRVERCDIYIYRTDEAKNYEFTYGAYLNTSHIDVVDTKVSINSTAAEPASGRFVLGMFVTTDATVTVTGGSIKTTAPDGIIRDITNSTSTLFVNGTSYDSTKTYGTINSIADAGLAEINAEVVDVLKTDTIAEITQGIPTTTPTFEEAVMYLYMALTKSIDVDNEHKEFHNEAGQIVWKKALSDDGDNYVEAKGESGA